MASSLEEFLAVENCNLDEKSLIVHSKDGTALEVDIQALPIDQIKRIRRKNIVAYKTMDGDIGATELDGVGYTLMMANAGIKAPNLRDARLLKKFNAQNTEEVLVGLFPISEIAKIAGEVENMSVGEGQILDGTDPKKVKEAKNS